MSRVLGVDTSLTGTGFAVLHHNDDGQWRGITWTAGRKGSKRESLRERDERLTLISSDLYAVDLRDLSAAVVEAPAFGAPGGSTWDRAGLWWRIVHRLLSEPVPLWQAVSSQRQKFAVGRASSAKNPVDKADVAMAAARMWPDVAIQGNDAADALVLASIAAVLADLPVPFPMHGYRQEVVDKIRATEEAA